MARKMRIAVFGAAGFVASVCIRTLVERDVEIVAAFGNKNHLREDLGELLGLGRMGVILSPSTEDNIAKTLDRTKPDLALDCSLNTIPDIYDHIKLCMERGVNVMAVGVQCYQPWRSDPELAKEIDEIGKRTGATYLGSGSAELWQSLPQVLSGLCGSVKKISLEFIALLDGFGEESTLGTPFASEPEEWGIVENNPEPSPWEPISRLIPEKLGLHVVSHEQSYKGIAAKKYMAPADLKYPIPAGTLVGYVDVNTAHTAEGIDVETMSYFKFREGDQTNSFTVRIEGEPDFEMVIPDFHGDVTTSTIMVNRIPDVVKAPGGVMMVNALPMISYHGSAAYELED